MVKWECKRVMVDPEVGKGTQTDSLESMQKGTPSSEMGQAPALLNCKIRNLSVF
jgi:hypothetical protein